MFPPTLSDNRPPITPQLALRVAVLGGIALVIFGVIFFRLWYLQVLSGDRFLAEANDNRIREIKVQAPRGQILDRDGSVLVDNRTGLAVQIEAQRLPRDPDRRSALRQELGRVLGMSSKRIQREIREQTEELPFRAVTLRHDVDYETVYYLQENQERFPGVKVERVFLRRYPKGTLGAHLFGNIGEVSRRQLTLERNRDLRQGDIVGQSGVELTYDRFLRGRNGATRIQVDSSGRPKGELTEQQARPGNNLRLTIDDQVQRAGEAALGGYGLPGGFVAMNVRSGEVLGLGSYPTFAPSVFTRRLSQRRVNQLFRSDSQPLANRAIQGLYPTGSTFKLISATAALQGGLITPSSIINDPGSLRVGGVTFKNAGDAVNGPIALRRALQVSSDVFFYTLGMRANSAGNGLLIQRWARQLGLGRPTGIDLPAETEGLIPSPEWRNDLYRRKQTDRPWSVGDNINLSVGQGDLQANPLQMAVAYSAVANGGRVVTPKLGLRVEDPGGRPLQEIRSQPRRRVDIREETRRSIMDGLRAAAMEPSGTSYAVFKDWPFAIAGKTGTAERFGQGDQSWYVAVAPYRDPEIVVALTIERGGFGAEAAAPAVKRILAAYFNVKPSQQRESSSSAGENLVD